MLINTPFIAALAVGASFHAHQPVSTTALQTLIVGGGPSLEYNQAAIESNVRYLDRILPVDSSRQILFASGDPNSKTVLCQDENDHQYFRQPQIRHIDGPSILSEVKARLTALSDEAAKKPNVPVLLYFTGHGSGDEDSKFTNNKFDLWSQNELTVRQLGDSLESFPAGTPITLVMVECFSGAFGNEIFEDGVPDAPLSDHKICGFFACVPQRMAAGCTPLIKEADYRDFTGYFFAALSGKDRLGRPISGADYDHDGKVEMDEAYAYSLIHDDSIDTPVCTSDVFLRRYVKVASDKVCLDQPYSKVLSWGTPAQKAALAALSNTLSLEGEDQGKHAYAEFYQNDEESEDPRAVHLIRFVRLFKTIVLAHDLMTHGEPDIQQKYKALVALEHRNLLG